MRIQRHTASSGHVSALQESLSAAARGRGVEGRVCGAQCAVLCQRCGATTCQCSCSPYCCDAPRMLTGDAAFPIEPLIAPLVYEMKRSACFDPCWSCEGHADASGAMTKPPTVWFYCEQPAHLRLLAGGLAKVRLHAPWRVVLTHSDADNPEPTFALEAAPGCATLAQLQSDAAAIARALPDMLREEARALVNAR